VVYGRKKRSTLARYIETRVVVDPTMHLYHRSRENAIAYTLMAFNIVSYYKVFKGDIQIYCRYKMEIYKHIVGVKGRYINIL
jgi:hypothetical protein